MEKGNIGGLKIHKGRNHANSTVMKKCIVTKKGSHVRSKGSANALQQQNLWLKYFTSYTSNCNTGVE